MPSRPACSFNWSSRTPGTRPWASEPCPRTSPRPVDIHHYAEDILWDYSDEVWRRCGDTSTDYNYYTKRILFNAAFASTELHLLTDQSAGKAQTWEFLDRRLDDILRAGKGVSDLKTVGGAAVDGLLSLMGATKVPPTSEVKEPISRHQDPR